MVGYLDSSVLLRHLLDEKGRLASFALIKEAISSVLLRVECLRTLDRARRENRLTEEEVVSVTTLFYRYCDHIEWVPITPEILTRASQPFVIGLGTLDAIHLSTAILYRERTNTHLHFCSHDKTLIQAAQTVGFEIAK